MELTRGGRQLIGFLPKTQEIIEFLDKTSKDYSPAPSQYQRSFKSQLISFPVSEPTIITLSQEESKHAISVLRLKQDEIIRIIDPDLNLVAQGELKITGKVAQVNVKLIGKNMRDYPIILIGMPETKTAESCVEKLTEIGVNKIIFFKADHSQALNYNSDKIEARLLKKRDAAVKQSYSLISPQICITTNLLEALNSTSYLITLFSPRDGEVLNQDNIKLESLRDLLTQNRPAKTLVIGPEGGFSLQELKLLISQESRFLSLGENTLRVETAATLAIASINCLGIRNSDTNCAQS